MIYLLNKDENLLIQFKTLNNCENFTYSISIHEQHDAKYL